MPPSIGEIPTAAQLQQQLDLLNSAVSALGEGAPVTYITVDVPPNPPDPSLFIMPIRIVLDPPITNVDTLTTLLNELTVQAEAIEQQLIDMGYAPPAKSAADYAEEAKAAIRLPHHPPPPSEPGPPPDYYTDPPPAMVPPPQPEGNPAMR